jgi:long-chain acyl-CoA synthetase
MYEVLRDTSRAHGTTLALQQPLGGGKYLTFSWNEYLAAAQEIAAGLRVLGIGNGDIVALNSETRAEFYLADLGVMTNGSVAAALYHSYPAADLLRTIANSGAKALFIETPKMLSALKTAPVEKFFLLTGEAEGILNLDQLRTLGRESMAADSDLLHRIIESVRASDNAILYLTSGATGEPKMVMVTHSALVRNIEMGPQVLPADQRDMTIAFLPSAHITQRVVMELLPIHSGIPVTFSESLMKLPGEMRSIRPTVFVAPPRFWERIYSTIRAEVNKKPKFAQRIFFAALGIGLAAARYRRQGKPVPGYLHLPLRLADKIAFTKIKDRFGGRMRVAISGGAPLGAELAEFYEAIGLPLVEGYGLTEGGVAVFNPIDRPKAGSIGKALPEVEVRFADDGEIQLRSPWLFSHYHNDPEATASVLVDGWLHTGDVGRMDEDGYVYITGRKKELIVLSNGKKVFPSRAEGLFKLEPLISQVVLVGDRQSQVNALVTIHPAAAEALNGMESWKGKAPHEIVGAAPVHTEVQRIISKVNRQLAPFEQIRKFRILPRDFTIETGEMTASMKVRRGIVLANYKAEVDDMYAAKESAVNNAAG